MVTRRKYRARADHAPAVDNAAAAAAPAPPVAPGPTPEGEGASPLTLALQAQQHAEHLQRQHATRAQVGLPEPPLDPATRQAVDAHIDSMNLSDHKKRFLKSHPSLLQQPHLQLMSHAYQLALHAGIPDDTPAMDAAVLGGIHLNLQHHRQLSQLTSAQARPTPENHQAHQDVTESASALAREAEQHFAAYQPAPIAPKPQRRSVPVQAPVSRNSPSVSGHPQQNNTLTAAEREIARNSFTDPNMSNTEKELLYLRNRQKYSRMKADGSYSEQTG